MSQAPQSPEATKLQEVSASIQALDYGEVTVVVHQGQIQEIKTTRRQRFPAAPNKPSLR